MIEILPDTAALSRAVAERVAARAADAIAKRSRFTLALAGGSTPVAAYRLLAGAEFAGRIDWSRVLVFWGDERCVEPDAPQSNYRMAREALLDHVPIPAASIHRIRGELDPRDAAEEYERLLKAILGIRAGADVPACGLDLVLLGMGQDGHTASLFPGNGAVRAGRRWVVAEYVESVGMWRVTLTPLVLNASYEVVFLVAGAAKAATLRAVLEGPFTPDRLPAQAVRPEPGRVTWLVDRAAASALSHPVSGVGQPGPGEGGQ
jgi:6-phosphogluconolactonase